MALPSRNGATSAARPAPTPAPPARPSRMTLANVVRGKQERPHRVVLYGVEGIGKSTFAADMPSPIFLGAEDGTAQLDVVRFPSPTCWEDVVEAIRVLGTEEHPYQTVVIDTLDWLEPLVWSKVCADAKVTSIEDVGGGYGKGYTAALDTWRLLLAMLDRLRERKAMHVVLLAHSHIKSFKNPEGHDFDRYELKLNLKAAGLVKEWADAVLFANFETFAAEDKRTKRAKGVSTGARVIYTTRTAAYDAKNRHNLPEELPLSWADFEAACRGSDDRAAKLEQDVEQKIADLGGPDAERARASLGRAKGDAGKLAQLDAWLNTKLAAKEAATTQQ